MITQIFLLYFFLLFPQCDTLSLEEEIKTCDIIAVAELEGVYGDLEGPYGRLTLLNIRESYKGFEDMIVLKGDFRFQPKMKYLVFADLIDNDEYGSYEIDPCSFTTAYANVSKETIDALNDLPCFDPSETIEERIRKHRERTNDQGSQLTGACERSGMRVCGCDGKTYGNTCEMHKSGIMRYTVGECE
ncbi:MAG: hypothetical protein GY816_03655 [Cytophagales bacterium]|nr:hypothetical protein [Cytophagales bacterium]